ncbi:MAG: MBL fold metallo-hydrolase [Ilumatobacteraceae bacterium]
MSEPRPPKQEQLPASVEITEVAPNILRTQLPISLPGLGHVNMYVLEDKRGVAVIDPGLPGRASWKALKSRLAAIGVPLKRVHSIIITHSHPDHFGGAARLRKETGADIITHESFRLWYDPTEPDDVDIENPPTAHPTWDNTPWGGDGFKFPLRRRLYFKMRRSAPTLFPSPRPTIRLAEGEHISLANREWVAIHTPGHTEDHLCLFDAEAGVMLCGDHVLPNITPHISGMTMALDPLAGFFASLDKVATFGWGVKVSLPAHGNPFSDLAGRCEEIKEHHLHRLEKLRQIATGFAKPATVTEFSGHLFSPRAQGPMADSETYAHLEHLRIRGEFDYHTAHGVRHYTHT